MQALPLPPRQCHPKNAAVCPLPLSCPATAQTWCSQQCHNKPLSSGCCCNALLCLFIGWTSCLSLFVRDFNLTGHKNLQGVYPLRLCLRLAVHLLGRDLISQEYPFALMAAGIESLPGRICLACQKEAPTRSSIFFSFPFEDMLKCCVS
jgi:hypothetical protein